MLAKTGGEWGWGMKLDTKKLSLNLSNCSLEERRKEQLGTAGESPKCLDLSEQGQPTRRASFSILFLFL